MTGSHLSILLHNTEVAAHKLRIALDQMGTTMRDYHMDADARYNFRTVRHDLEYCLESVMDIKKTLDNQDEEGESAQVVTP